MSPQDSELSPSIGPPTEPPVPLPPGKPVSAPLPPPPPTDASGKARWRMPVAPGTEPLPSPPDGAARAGAPQGAASAPEATGEHDENNLKELAIKNAPPWLVSLLVHMLLVIILGLWFLPVELPKLVSLEVLSIDEPINEPPEELNLDDAQLGVDTGEAIDVINPENLTPVDDPFAAPPDLEIGPGGLFASSKVDAPAIGNALSGREEGTRRALIGTYGGTGKTEAAVAAGLAWLANHQRSDGSWSLQGPYSDGSQFENVAAATAMALLAFQGAGNTHEKGKYKNHVEKGIDFLLRLQDEHGNFFHKGPLHSGLYSQAQCTIAVCELFAMSQDSRLREPAQRAIQYCLSAQDKRKGGWRYIPGEDSDTSVTGWFVMALQSAKMGGLEIPSPVWAMINQFLESVAYEGGSRYAYLAGGEVKRSMTAEGLLCRQWLGWDRNDQRLNLGADFLVVKENLPDWDSRDVYYWYYATQVLHNLDDDRWHTWNHLMREILPNKQEKKGPEMGSWHPTGGKADQWGYHGGRLYVTCLSIYILEVYYRHLPLYATAHNEKSSKPAAVSP
jgi:hypothetical protein